MESKKMVESMIGRILNSIAVKVGIIGALILILLIPAAMVRSLIEERRGRQMEAINEISGKWGGSQVISGPVITVPYTMVKIDSRGRPQTITEKLNILPEELNITGELIPEIRYRGIYKTVLYQAKLLTNGSFVISGKKVEELLPDAKTIEWDKATITLGITDMRGIREAIDLKVNDKKIELEPGSAVSAIIPYGVKGRLNLTKNLEKQEFSINLNLNGSHDVSFIPLGKTTVVNLKSKWDSPSFNGAYLPIDREVTDSGFSATWKIFEFNRDYPQMWKNDNANVCSSAFGVRLFIGNDIYNQAIRTVKYAILFILFTFASIFLSEIISKSRVHPFQYLLIGCAVTIFYVLLISLSEHLNFSIAYLISAIAIVGLIFTYIKCIFDKVIMPVVIGAIQSVLYLYFYVTLQSEDYALLMGSLGLFTVLAVVMYVTRRINWHEMHKVQE